MEKIVMIDDCIGCAISGLAADARTLIEHGRVETQVFIIFILNKFFMGFLSCWSLLVKTSMFRFIGKFVEMI